MMIQLFDDLFLIENKLGANVYLIDNGDSFDLIDSAMFKETSKLVSQIEANGYKIKNLKTIILTHCHCDHIGGAYDLVKQSNAKVAAHQDDIKYILQQDIISGSYHNMMIQEQKYMKKFDCVLPKIDIVLTDGDFINSLGGLQIIHVPGHTPGSIALYQPERKIMFFGDVIRNKEKKGLVVGEPAKFNFDTKRTIDDYRKLVKHQIEYALFGHGKPVIKDASKQFSKIELP